MRTAIRRSPTSRATSRGRAVFVEESGWEIPASYGDDPAERAAIRDRVAIADITARAKVDIRGDLPDAWVVPANAVIGRLSRDQAIVLGEPGAESALLRTLEPLGGPATMVTDVTHLFAGFALVGPGLPALIELATSWDLSDLDPGAATAASMVEVRSLLVRRDLAIPALEVYVATELGGYAWEALSDLVAGLGGALVGWHALRAEGWR